MTSKRSRLWLIALAALASVSPAAALTDAALPDRVVIAPPQNEVARSIRTALAADYAGAPRGTAAHETAQGLYFLYGERYFEPIFVVEDAAGDIALSPSAQAVLEVFAGAADWGLRPEDYLTEALAATGRADDPEAVAALETAFSSAALLYARHAHAGRIDPRAVSVNMDIAAKRIDEAALMAGLAESGDPAAVLLGYHPTHPQFLALREALLAFDDPATPRHDPLPEGPSLRPGASDPRVPLLRARLKLPADADADALLYDTALVEAVTAFQADLALEPDGIVGPATVAALNGGSATTRADIVANMERWRWMPSELGDFHVFVNIPEFRLHIASAGQETYTTRVVVGTVRNQTPVFSDRIRHVVMNPYWNVPRSIINEEIIPAVLRNPNYLVSQDMELLYNGEVVGVHQVNWPMVGPDNFPFRVRQRPGPGNALGTVKFLFPNSHDVYLHDTPSKSLFARTARAFSHGCVRVENPMEFADALLAQDPNLSRASLEALYGPSERWVNPTTPIPVHLAYFTLTADADGTLRAFGDVYGHNARLIELMGA